jgi:hypothetical protein
VLLEAGLAAANTAALTLAAKTLMRFIDFPLVRGRPTALALD